MDYGYGHEERQFEDNVVGFDGVEEEQEEYYEDIQQQQREGGQQGEGIGSGGNEGRQTSLITQNRDSSISGKLFVGGVSWETTEETFTNYFSKYGEVRDSVIMMDRHSGRPRGFGFITFADPAVADRVLEEDHVIDGRQVEVKKTVPREDMELKGVIRTKKIFVGGIPPSLTEDELKDYFSVYGSVVEHQIMLDHKTGRSRGFGFVTFNSEDAIEQIFSEGKTHELGGKQVEIKKAVPKRAGGDGDYSSTSKPYGRFGGGGAGGYGAASGSQYGGKMGRGYGGYGDYGSYNGYGGYGGGYAGNAAGFYGGYGAYGYGFGFGGPMMYGAGGYGNYGYGTPSGYGSSAGYGGGKGYGRNDDTSGFGGGKGYGTKGYSNSNGSAGNGGFGNSKGYEVGFNNGAGGGGRYHPYRK